MIFKQYLEVLRQQKTETRRLGLRDNLKPGNLLAMQPERGKAAWWFGLLSGQSTNVKEPIAFTAGHYIFGRHGDPTAKWAKEMLIHYDFLQARIQIASVHSEPLQAITYDGAIAEGVASVDEYATLWNSINSKPGIRWQDNPTVTVIRFVLERKLAHFLSLYPEVLT